MPSWNELKRFCDNDGWELYKDTGHFEDLYHSLVVGLTRQLQKEEERAKAIQLLYLAIERVPLWNNFFLKFNKCSVSYHPSFNPLCYKIVFLLFFLHKRGYKRCILKQERLNHFLFFPS